MRILISDASILTDLSKADAVPSLLQLSHDFIVLDLVLEQLESQLLLMVRNLPIHKFSGNDVYRVEMLARNLHRYSSLELFALVAAESYIDPIVLTESRQLQLLAARKKFSVRNASWAFSEISRNQKSVSRRRSFEC